MTALPARPGHADLARLGSWLERLDETTAGVPAPPGCFLVLTPLGLSAHGWLREALSRLGIERLAVVPLRCWSRLSTAVQVRRRDPAALERALVFEALWRAVAPADQAEAWLLPPSAHEVVAARKRELRQHLPNLHVDARPLLARAASLHALHLPDPADVVIEARRLVTALGLVGDRADAARVPRR